MAESPIQIRSAPGIKRDGTRLEGDAHIDGQWVRWQRKLPRKIGGFRAINKYFSNVTRALSEFTSDNLTYIHAGSASAVERLYLDSAGNTSIITDRTPLADYTPDDRNLWVFSIDGQLNAGVNTQMLIAQVAPNMEDISNTEGGELFYGDILATTPLTTIALPTGGSATGGVVALHPYTFFFGNDGYIGWSIAGDPTDLSGVGSGAVNAAAQKIVAGLPLRGGPGNSPAGLFWSLDSLVRASFVGGTPVFQFDTISAQTSILSSRSPIEYDGIFYWIGVDRFLMFNGVVREIPNDMNQNFFFDNLDYDQRQKVFATKVPRFGEIWWCYPTRGAVEPDRAIIYNVRDNIWYDTALPVAGRSAGIFPTVFSKPLMSTGTGDVSPIMYRDTEDDDTRITEDGDVRITEESERVTYKLWIHEQGVDEIDGQNIQPILSYFETGEIAMPVDKGVEGSIHIAMIEPDFVQSGDMTVQVRSRQNARAPVVNGESMTFPDVATTPDQEPVFLKTQARLLSLYFESNVIGGDYQMGVVLAHVSAGDKRTLS